MTFPALEGNFCSAVSVYLWLEGRCFTALKVPDAGLLELLGQLSPTFFNTLKLRLFKNNYTPVAGTVLGDLTEADFTGYAAQTMSGFSAPAIVGGAASTTGDQKTFAVGSSPSTSNNIYGYYVTDSGNTKLYWAERDANAPISMAVFGQIYQVTPNFTEVSQ